MESFGYILGAAALVICYTLAKKVAKLERVMKEAGLLGTGKQSLREIIEKNLGKTGTLRMEEKSIFDFEMPSKCRFEDIDEEWLLITDLKKGKRNLIRINAIKSVQLH